MQTIDLSLWQMAAVYALFLVPLGIFAVCRIGLVRETIVSALRMSAQLTLVALYLGLIFELNHWWLSGLWIVIMVFVANMSVLQKAGVNRRHFFVCSLGGIAVSTALVAGFLVFAIIRPTPAYDARYLIPITGMILGNCLRGNVLSLERFYSGIRDNEKTFLTYLMLGATLHEAVRPYLRNAIKAATAPILSTMATTGIVSLPGMMTGQILGGAPPTTAIKYQIAIMVCIFTAITLATLLNILFSMRVAFDEYGMLKSGLFR